VIRQGTNAVEFTNAPSEDALLQACVTLTRAGEALEETPRIRNLGQMRTNAA